MAAMTSGENQQYFIANFLDKDVKGYFFGGGGVGYCITFTNSKHVKLIAKQNGS